MSSDLLYFEQTHGMIDDHDLVHPDSSATDHIAVDRAIAVDREQDPDRMIIHLTLPHLPFIGRAIDWEPGQLSVQELMEPPETTRPLHEEETTYRPYAYDEGTEHSTYDNYLMNLRLTLDYVDILRNNIDAERAVLSADHGEALGE